MSRSAILGRTSWTMLGLVLLLLSPLSGCSSGKEMACSELEGLLLLESARFNAEVEADLIPELVRGGRLIAGGEIEEGIEVLKTLLPRSAHPAPIHERIAGAWFDIGEAESAARHIDSAVALGGPTLERLLLRGRIRNAMWDDSGAIEDFDRVLSLDSSNLQALYLSAHILVRIDPDRSIERYRRILELRPEDLTALEELYNTLGRQRRFTEAAGVAERIYALDPGHEDIVPGLPLVWLAAGDADRAIDWFRRIVSPLTFPSAKPTPLDAFVENLDRLYGIPSYRPDSTIERFALAVVTYIEEASVQRSFPTGLIAHGSVIAYRAGDEATGDTLAGRLSDRQHLPDRLRITVARNALAAGSSRIAIRLLEGLPAGVNDPEPAALLGKAYLAEGRLEEAEKAFSGARKADPDGSGPLLGLARLHALRNDPSEAVRMFELAVAIDPEDPEVVTHYGWYLGVTGRHLERGYELVRRIVPEHIDDPDLLEAYAMLAWLTGKRQLAESILTAVDIEHDLTPWGLSVWGEIYISLDRIPMALELWRRGLEGLNDPTRERGPRPEVEYWKEELRTELLRKINSYGE